jgi:hypothetical protein
MFRNHALISFCCKKKYHEVSLILFRCFKQGYDKKNKGKADPLFIDSKINKTIRIKESKEKTHFPLTIN